MLTLYLGLSLAGSVLLVVPLLGGQEVEGDAAQPSGQREGASEGWAWLPWASLRFWSFALAFAGLTGSLLTLLGMGGAATAVAALGVGWVSGGGVTLLVARLHKTSADGTYTEDDYRGQCARVLLPIVPQSVAGRVRLRIAGRDVDRPAVSEDGRAIAIGDEVVVWRVLGDGTLVVTATETALVEA